MLKRTIPENLLATIDCSEPDTYGAGLAEERQKQNFDRFRLTTLEQFLILYTITATVDWGSPKLF